MSQPRTFALKSLLFRYGTCCPESETERSVLLLIFSAAGDCDWLPGHKAMPVTHLLRMLDSDCPARSAVCHFYFAGMRSNFPDRPILSFRSLRMLFTLVPIFGCQGGRPYTPSPAGCGKEFGAVWTLSATSREVRTCAFWLLKVSARHRFPTGPDSW